LTEKLFAKPSNVRLSVKAEQPKGLYQKLDNI